jgi:hypothetical protein
LRPWSGTQGSGPSQRERRNSPQDLTKVHITSNLRRYGGDTHDAVGSMVFCPLNSSQKVSSGFARSLYDRSETSRAGSQPMARVSMRNRLTRNGTFKRLSNWFAMSTTASCSAASGCFDRAGDSRLVLVHQAGQSMRRIQLCAQGFADKLRYIVEPERRQVYSLRSC